MFLMIICKKPDILCVPIQQNGIFQSKEIYGITKMSGKLAMPSNLENWRFFQRELSFKYSFIIPEKKVWKISFCQKKM